MSADHKRQCYRWAAERLLKLQKTRMNNLDRMIERHRIDTRYRDANYRFMADRSIVRVMLFVSKKN